MSHSHVYVCMRRRSEGVKRIYTAYYRKKTAAFFTYYIPFCLSEAYSYRLTTEDWQRAGAIFHGLQWGPGSPPTVFLPYSRLKKKRSAKRKKGGKNLYISGVEWVPPHEEKDFTSEWQKKKKKITLFTFGRSWLHTYAMLTYACLIISCWLFLPSSQSNSWLTLIRRKRFW